MRRVAVLAAWTGLVALQVALARSHLGLGTWWHWLLHQQLGEVVAGQLASIVPDLQSRFGRMPHEPSMDVRLGHIAIHTGPSPVLVAVG